jgi:transcriptional regulator with XRE-family HTH domain
MTGPELDTALKSIGWSRSELGRRIGRTPSHVDAWARGARPLPAWVAEYVLAVRAAVDAVEVPVREKPQSEAERQIAITG